MADQVTQDSEALVHSYNLELQYYSNQGDPLMALEGTSTTGKNSPPPQEIMMRQNLGDMQADQTTRMLMPLRGAPYLGDGVRAEDTGEYMRIKTNKGWVNSYGKVVDEAQTTTTYQGHLLGKDIFNSASKLLQDYLKQLRGTFARQGMIQRYSENITTAAFKGPQLTPGWIKNWYICGVPAGVKNVPEYDSNPATFEANIAAILAQVDQSSSSLPVAQDFNNLGFAAAQKFRINAIGGRYNGKMVIMTSERTSTYMQNLTNAAGVQALRKSTFNPPDAAKAWMLAIGDIGRFTMIDDPVAPILVMTKSNGALQVIYRGVGEDDPRALYMNDDTYAVFDINIVCGRASVLHTVAQLPQYNDQIRDLNRLVQIGASAIEGWSINEFDEPVAGDQGDLTRVNQAGAVFITPSGSLTY